MANAATSRNVPWRAIGWGGAAALLAIPFIAMQFNNGVNWGLGDFIFAGALLAILGGLFELVAKTSTDWNYRVAVALGLLGSLLVIWVNLAVGIVGSEDRAENLWFFGALLVGLVGAAVSKLRPRGMAAAMLATAVSLGIAFAIAAIGPTDEPHVPHGRELIGTGVFAALFLISAALFRRAALLSRPHPHSR